jgi:oxygen-dependent protoporphyrinogen oxidase
LSGTAARRARRVVVVGGGITGLAAARALTQQRQDLALSLLEARSTLGGNIITEQHEGFLLDGGPDSFLRTKPDAVELIDELGLRGELLTPQARNVYVVHRGKLELMPAGLALAVPTRLGPVLRTPVLSLGGKLRVLADLWRPAKLDEPQAQEQDESIEDFVVRRFGREAAQRLVSPLLGGIYAGEAAALSMRSTFPQLLQLEQQHGSVIRGVFAAQRARHSPGDAHPAARVSSALGKRYAEVQGLVRWLRRPDAPAPSPFYSLRGGLGTLVTALGDALPRGSVLTNVTAQRVERGAGAGRGWRVVIDGREPIDTDAVILTVPAHVAARLVPDPELATELAALPYASTATVFVALRREDVCHPLDGVGFVVPRGEAAILAATWVSSKWAHRAPPGGVLLRAFVGGAGAAVSVTQRSDEQLVELALAELARLQGRMGTPLFTRVFRYVDANPQPVLGHGARLRSIRQRLDRLAGLELAGASYEGVGIPDCVKQARAAATRVLRQLGLA